MKEVMSLGQKIKKLRVDNDIKQTSVYKNQSQISQIESGKISNPDEHTVRQIAQGLEVTFEDLIEGTNWKPPQDVINIQYYAISPDDYDVALDNKGKVSITNKVHPLTNANGEVNKFCPTTGYALIIECEKCKRKIDSRGITYCPGCGHRLIEDIILIGDIVDMINDNMIDDFNYPENQISNLNSMMKYIDEDYNMLKDKLDNFNPVKLKDAERKLTIYNQGRNRIFTKDVLDKDKLKKEIRFNDSNYRIVRELINCYKDKRDIDTERENLSPQERFEADTYNSMTQIIDGLKNPTLMKVADKEFDPKEQLKILNNLGDLIGRPVEELDEFVSSQAADEIKSSGKEKASTEEQAGEEVAKKKTK